jgi:hypothetical protein
MTYVSDDQNGSITQGGSCSFRSLRPAIDNHQLCAFRTKSSADLFADARTGSSHQRNAALKS